ncbi:hypothetical protein BVG19_g2288 [[Candida] boidinii]|nr:hypothetical protein BVG19_g2288 [[Candida] boidinii]OWB48870.1 hypothetical protein B5S27_g407 [[Candida] boidinii]OWB82166.1 hypothetical protein B5S33_g788 [[Candida] boidinii]
MPATATETFSPTKQSGKVVGVDVIGSLIDLSKPSKNVSRKVLNEAKQADDAKRKPHDAAFMGWKEVGGWEQSDALSPSDELMDLLTRATFLDNYLPEIAYGDWYHNAAIIILGALLCWVIGKFGFGLGPTFIITFISAVYYRASIRKYRFQLRIDAQREFSVAQIEEDFESMNWLNVFLDKYWIFLEPSISQMVCDIANPILADSPAPQFIKDLWIQTLTLGTKPPRIDKVRTLSRTTDDIVVMEWWVSNIPNALADATGKQLKNKINQLAIVKAKLFGLSIPVTVSDVSFSGKFRVRIRMMSSFPHIQTVNVSLVEPPQFDFNAKVSGSSIFSWEVLNIPGLYRFINQMVKKFVGPILFQPLSFQLNVEQLLAGNGINGSIGILEIDIKDGKNLQGVDTYDNTVDPYLTFAFGNNVLAKTKIIHDTFEPVWNEKIRLSINSISEPVRITLFDENESEGRKDKVMGTILLDIEDIINKGTVTNQTVSVLRNNKEAGDIGMSFRFSPTLQGSKLPDGSYTAPPDLNTGVVKLELLGARNYAKEPTDKISAFAEVFLSKEKILTSGATKKSATASWSLIHECIIYDRSKSVVRVVLRDSKTKQKIGSSSLRLLDIIDSTFVDNTWVKLTSGLGEVRISAIWNSVRLKNYSGSIGYTQPIGVLRILIKSASGLLNLEKIGTITPYMRVLVNGTVGGRTLTQGDTVDPEFNESLYIPVTSINQIVVLEAMDVERHTPDRTLGSFSLQLNDIVETDESGKYITTVGEESVGHLIHKKRGPHGTVKYSLSFYPTIPTMSPEDKKQLNKIEATRKEKAAAADSEKSDSKSSATSDSKKKKSEVEEIEDEEDKELMSEFNKKMDLPLEKVTDYQQGILAFNIIDGSFPKEGYLQFFFDKYGYSTFESDRLSPSSKSLSIASDAIIKELDFSTVTIKYSSKKGGNLKSESIAEVSMKTIDFIKNTYQKPSDLKIGPSQIRISSFWMPLQMDELPSHDSIGNTGSLKLRILDASDLPAADSNGFSDPLVQVYVNGKLKYKTKTIKKTLNPVWNEETEIEIEERTFSVLRLKVMDWDIGIEQDDKLGEYNLFLSQIDPFDKEWQEFVLRLLDDDQKEAGSLRIQCRFNPYYLTRFNAVKELPNVGNLAVDGTGKLVTVGTDSASKVLGVGMEAGSKVLGVGGKLFHSGGHLFKKSKD